MIHDAWIIKIACFDEDRRVPGAPSGRIKQYDNRVGLPFRAGIPFLDPARCAHVMFSGLSAFPLTPVSESALDEAAFVRLIERLVDAGVDSICALGSTGSYPYLTRAERARIARLAVEHAGPIPVMVGVGALRTRDVLDLVHDAQQAGVRGVLLAPVSYQLLLPDEVYGLYEAVSRSLSVPLCVYDNPRTTRFEFSDALHGRIARLPHVASIKIPAVPLDPDAARERVARLRAQIPAQVTIGVSGDASAAQGLLAGCEAWYSVVGGLFPRTALAITRAAQAGDARQAAQQSERLAPLWALYRQCGSVRVMAAAAEILGLAQAGCLPLPLRPLQAQARQQLESVLAALQLG